MMRYKKINIFRRTLVLVLIALLVMTMQVMYTYGLHEIEDSDSQNDVVSEEDIIENDNTSDSLEVDDDNDPVEPVFLQEPPIDSIDEEPQSAMAARSTGDSIIIDLFDVENLNQPLSGYTYNSSEEILTFTGSSSNNSYEMIFSGTEQIPVKTIEFTSDAAPTSVTFNDLDFGTLPNYGQIRFPEYFSGGSIIFNNVKLNAALLIRTGFAAKLGINGLTTTTLAFAPDYQDDLVFNGLTAKGGLFFAENAYNGNITITGTVFDVPYDKQLPQTYTKSTITISGGLFI